MIMKNIKYQKYSGMMTRSVRTSRRTTRSKPGIILRLENTDGKIGFGEAAPLKGYSNEGLDDVEEALEKLVVGSGNKINIADFINEGVFNNVPSLLFGIEQAVWNIKRQDENTAGLKGKLIPVNYMIGSTELDETVEAVSMVHVLGWKTVKLKLGVKPFDVEIQTIEKIQALFPDLKLRFDMNGAWSYTEAVRCIKLLSEFNVEFIEQPVEGLKPLIELAREVPIPVAPDESLVSFDKALSAITDPGIEFIVVKPMKFGFANSIKLIETAKKYGKKIILTTLFESAVGLSALTYLASLINHQSAHGIFNYLAVDKFNQIPDLKVIDGTLSSDYAFTDFKILDQLFG